MFADIDVVCLPLNPSIIGKFLAAGFNTASSLDSVDANSLSKSANIPKDEADQAIRVVKNATRKQKGFTVQSALDFLQEQQEQEYIVTFSECLDSMLGGGVRLQELTEICGPPGSGKTQLCFQLAVDTQIPRCLGGVEGDVVFIDTEKSFVVERVVEIAKAAQHHCQHVSALQGSEYSGPPDISVEQMLSGIHYYYSGSYHDLVATLQILPSFLSENQQVKLLVIDSLARPLQRDMEDTIFRGRLLAALTQNLLKIAAEYKLAVVVTNQMTTKILPRAGDSHLIPALGDNWAHMASARVVLSADMNGSRTAMLYKAHNKEESKCSFQITADGIRDIS